MANTSQIEWCDSTFNPWIGCTKISPACDHCYASVAHPTRALGIEWGAGKPRHRTSVGNWKQPLRWNARQFWQCLSCGWRGDDKPELRSYCPGCARGVLVPARRRVFCASLADVFDNEVDPQWRADLFALIEATPNLDWLLLTKRVGNVARMVMAATGTAKLPDNVWLGATICNQAEADRDIPKLLELPAAVRFLSMEPLLGEVDLTYPESLFPNGPARCCNGHECGCMGQPIDPPLLYGLNWVIVGGESGSGARPMHPAWALSLRDQCAAANVPFLFKQWGDWAPVAYLEYERRWAPNGGRTHMFQEGPVHTHTMMELVGKHVAGRKLVGVQHDGYPRERSHG